MDGFKPMVKMKCGGSVSKAVEEAKKCSGGRMKAGGKVHDDEAQDKALIKKELGKFAKAEDKGEKTELKLKSGGRTKKAAGSVKKFKAGGAIEMKKDAGDKDAIKKVKATGDKKAAAPSKGAAKSKDVKKFAGGGSIESLGHGGSFEGDSPIPPSIQAQLMQAVQGSPMPGTNPIPGDKPVMGGAPVMGAPVGGMGGGGMGGRRRGMRGGMGGGNAQPFNAYQNFQQQNPNAQPGMDPRAIQKLLQSPQFQQSNRNFTDQ
ncbi:hypothetical protein UFOVP118_64 [uncultured Caudovirales phage]|uniref:Uncharacterized protein n=1 Tax=uncultured Caudovirales phage TaxID=2100421 RepID=A0A6J5L620_9CAUD|nr:hypothetical protein UFOVP118_64 [uncultured Caudovirales phage]